MLLVVSTVNISTLKGIHGTTKYHAANISVNGFALSPTGKVGKAGKGIYFWYYAQDRTTAIHCAETWSSFALAKGFYDEGKDCKIVKFDVHIESDEEKVLDFDAQMRESFYTAFPIGEYKERSYGAKLDLFIEELEKNLNFQFNLLKISLSVPNLGQNVAFSNSFLAIIVKNEVDIKIIEYIE